MNEKVEWESIDTAPEGLPVLTKIDEGGKERNVQPLRLRNRLWWFIDQSMYVYYRPTHWAPLPAEMKAELRQREAAKLAEQTRKQNKLIAELSR